MMISKNILHYKILKKLGEGGMGIVYLAEDTKLKRKVAIKFLPNYISADEEERKRFEIEAQAAASLNHPNIATVHSIEEAEDPQHGTQTFIVMEYIEGKELKDIIRRKYAGAENIQPLQMNDIINYAIQIAKGLETAHRKGIIHRDIKSSNIMITNDGNVKIMDFGLAKVGKGAQLTKIGTTIGTAAYMSPEQARGEEVDNRTDIWSFGVVLYEMLTGELPFKGDYDQAIIYSIMNNEPDSLQKYLPEVSSTLIKIIDKTLEKDPENRYKTMQDVLNDLKYTEEKTGRLKVYSEKDILKESKTKRITYKKNSFFNLFRNRLFQVSATFFLIAVIILLFLWFSGPSLPEINPNRHISAVQIPVANFDYPAISADGKMLAIPGSDVNGNWDVYLMDIKSGDSRKLGAEKPPTGITGRISSLKFSPDGSRVMFGEVNPPKGIEGIYIISVLSGFVRVVADTGVPSCWNKKNNRIYYFRGIPRAPSRSGWREYWSISPEGTNAKLEFIDSLLQGAVNNFTLSISPDGKEAAFTRPFRGDFNEIIVRDLESGKERRLTYDKRTINDISWLDNGYILFDSDRSGNFNIWVIPQNGGKLKQITDETFNDVAMSFSAAADRLTYQQLSITGTLWRVNTDGSGNKQIFTGLNIWYATYSPDGSKIAIISRNQFSPNTSLTMRDIKSDQQATLLPADSYKMMAQFSPSGRFISYLEFPEGPAVSYGKIKVLDVSKGNQPRDFGYGYTFGWLNDSVIVIQRVIAKKYVDFKHLGGRGKMLPSDYNKRPTFSPRLLNIRTGKENKFFRDSVSFAVPVLNRSSYIYNPPHTSETYIVSEKELEKNPEAKGKLLFNGKKLGIQEITFSNQFIYYKARNAIWKLDLRTLKISEIIDLPGIAFNLSQWGYNDNFVSYIQRQTKTSIVKVDSVFIR